MHVGALTFRPVAAADELVAEPVRRYVAETGGDGLYVAAIDPELADTAAFCAHYEIDPAATANCVVVQARRGERSWYAACVVLAATRADINGAVRKHLGARKVSFAPMPDAVRLTGMEYGGITPVGLPADWPVLIDEQVIAAGAVVIGGGLRGSKLLAEPAALRALPGAEVLPIALG
ncbi:YbaK/EbsC family protein [uncultured Mycolicibacterium sp.]|uniref:YbaK/EbsC family protein n=1 Tax=uncultured Mycolicibacterium sp. TaxID=2320817 RepID=UPI00261CD066|nr:YbaK/EbsC family protein [uncultured Mycolicibacterium sp.]